MEQGHVHAEPIDGGTVRQPSTARVHTRRHTHTPTLFSHSDTAGIVNRGHIEMEIQWGFYLISSPDFLLMMMTTKATPNPHPPVLQIHVIMENGCFSSSYYIIKLFKGPDGRYICTSSFTGLCHPSPAPCIRLICCPYIVSDHPSVWHHW